VLLSLVWTFAFLAAVYDRDDSIDSLCSDLSLLPATLGTDVSLNPSPEETKISHFTQPPMLFSRSDWDLREYLLTATLPEITGVGLGEDGPLIVPAGHKSHANHLATRPSPHRLLKSVYVLDYEMLRSTIGACTFRFHPGHGSHSLHFPVISGHAPKHAHRVAEADPVSKERVTVSSSPHFIINLPCPFSDPQCIDG
jgi:hypothetical protein